jgi:enoyl-CoA hydratase/carnithine racemase
VVVLRGAGEAFCSGLDLQALHNAGCRARRPALPYAL